MTPNLLELAKQGDPNAIADLMNRSLQPKGITAQAERQGDYLEVVLAADQIPNRQSLTTFVQNGIINLGIQSIRSIKIVGQQTGANSPAWTEEINLDVPVSSTEPAIQVVPPPPPPRPAPPPVPPLRSAPPMPPLPAEEVAPASFEQPIAEVISPPGIEPLADERSDVPLEQEQLGDRVTSPEPIAPGDERLDDEETVEATPVEFVDAEFVDLEPEHNDTNDVEDSSLVEPRRSQSALSPLLFVALLLLAGWIGFLIGYPLWRELSAPSEPEPDPNPSPVSAAPIAATPIALATPVPQTNAYQQAIDKATRVTALTQSAQSGDDWSLVVSQWQQAIDLLSSVPASSPDYASAQQRLTEYQRNLAAAQQRVASQPAVTEAPLSSTTVTVSDDITCQPIESNPESQPVELTSVQFAGATEGEENRIVGCITNHTEQAIASVRASYRASAAENPNLFQGGYNDLNFSNLEAGQTVPFSSDFTISPEVTNVSIESVYWTPQELQNLSKFKHQWH